MTPAILFLEIFLERGFGTKELNTLAPVSAGGYFRLTLARAIGGQRCLIVFPVDAVSHAANPQRASDPPTV
jgi:hypothetical protein